MTLPAQLRDYCHRHQLTQAQAAARLGVNVDTFQNWIAARNAPRGLALSSLLTLLSRTKCRPAPRGSSNKPTRGTRAETRGGKSTKATCKPRTQSQT